MRFQALTEHQLLVLWVQLLLLVLVARGLGAVVRRFGQPAVIGELAAGVVLGPSVLGWIAPAAWDWLFPSDPVAAGLMAAIGWIGVFLLLVLAGYETDLGLVRRLGRAAAAVSAGSLVVPLACGALVGFTMPARFLGRGDDPLGFALFMATALAISSLPVVAKVLSDLDLMRRNFGQLTLAAGMANDVVGWVLLGLLASLAKEGGFDWMRLGLAVGGLAVLLPGSLTVGQHAVDASLRAVRQRGGSVADGLTVTVLMALFAAALTQAIGLEGVLGAFVAGIVLGRSKFQDAEVFAALEHVTVAVFAPIFFARAGLQVDLALLADPTVVLWAVIVLAAASLSKFLGAWLGARAAALPSLEGLALGAGLNARGALEVVVATVGLGLGVLNQASYTVIVLMAIATSMLAPVLLRAVVRRWAGTPEEQQRLERERQLDRNVLVRPARVLLLSNGGPNSLLAARVLDRVWPADVEVTVLSIGTGTVAVEPVLAAFLRRPVEHVHLQRDDTVAAVLEQARLGYGLITIGATDRRREGQVVSPLVDELLATSPLPLLIVRRGTSDSAFAPGRILVPAEGTVTGRAAQEIGFAMACETGTEVLLAHVVTVPRQGIGAALFPWRRRPLRENGHERADVAARVVDEARRFAEELGVRATTFIRSGVSAADELLTLARDTAAAVVVLTASVRRLSGRPFLGHGIEHLLERSEAVLVIVATPPGWGAAGGVAAQATGSSQASPAA